MKSLNPSEIKKMEQAGRVAAQVLKQTGAQVRSGVTTNELNAFAHELTLSMGATPAPLGYHGFPKSICTSVNSVICHGVPDDMLLKDGDVINIDVTCIVDGFHGDTSAMFFVGSVMPEAQNLARVAYEAMHRGIEQVQPGATTGDIGFAIQKYVTRHGYFVVREIGGHGIGAEFHTDPFVPSHGKKGRGETLRPWTCITVEPMVNMTSAPIKELSIPNSSIKVFETSDSSLSCQYEHTVLITDVGFEILTLEH